MTFDDPEQEEGRTRLWIEDRDEKSQRRSRADVPQHRTGRYGVGYANLIRELQDEAPGGVAVQQSTRGGDAERTSRGADGRGANLQPDVRDGTGLQGTAAKARSESHNFEPGACAGAGGLCSIGQRNSW